MKTTLMIYIPSLLVAVYITWQTRNLLWRKSISSHQENFDPSQLMPDGKTMYGNKPLRSVRP